MKSTPTLKELTSLYVLDSVKGFGPVKFKNLFILGLKPEDVLDNPERFQLKGKQGDKLRNLISEINSDQLRECENRAIKQLEVANELNAGIITYSSPFYPKNVFESNNPIPVLYVRGDINILKNSKSVACVGSRNTVPPYTQRQEDFVKHAVQLDFSIVSGFAMGADIIAHKTALNENGTTIATMPCGLDLVFPPEHKNLWIQLLNRKNVVFVSEFGFGVRANSLTLKKRNKLIVALSKGVVIAQSSNKGGAMNAYRFAIEQKKPVASFQNNNLEDTSGNKFIKNDEIKNNQIFHCNTIDKDSYKKWLSKLTF